MAPSYTTVTAAPGLCLRATESKKLYTREEIRKHNSREDCWVIVHQNRVYDVTKFLSDHPGEEELILQHAGQDISDIMADSNTHAHSKAAYNLLRNYYIGQLKDDNNNLEKKKESENNDMDMNGWNEDLVDWNRGMVCQAHKYGRDYFRWVHAPVNRPLRLFDNDFVEFFSKTSWWVVPVLWVPVVLYLYLSTIFTVRNVLQLAGEKALYDAFRENPQGYFYQAFVVCSLYAVLGLPLWTLLEYILHRYMFHLEPTNGSKYIITFHFLMHGQHHKVPFDKGRLVFPPVPAAIMAAIVHSIIRFVTPLYGTAVTSGILTGYVTYDLIHYYLHHGSPKRGSYFHSLKYYHVLHHFDDYNTGFGISSKLWDYPFSTINEKFKNS